MAKTLEYAGKEGNYDEIIHITVGSGLSRSNKNAVKVAELVRENKSSTEIVTELKEIKDRVSTTFIAEKAHYLYQSGRVSKLVKDICRTFKIHPVLELKKGEIK